MRGEPILFIFGAARSGTSFLSGLIRESFDYGLGPEPKFLVDVGCRIARYGDLQRDDNLDRLIEYLLNVEMMKIFRTKYTEHYGRPMQVTLQEVRDRLSERSYTAVVYALLACMARRLGKGRVGAKYPDFWKHLHLLRSWYPDARFLHLVRDGRDVSLSTLRLPWGESSVYSSARQWCRVMRAANSFSKCIPAAQFLELRYEDVLTEPHGTLERLERFLDYSTRPEERSSFIAAITDNPLQGNFDKWRTEMSEDERRCYEGIAGDYLHRLGYRCTCREPHISWSEHLFYSTGDFINRASNKLGNMLKPL